MSKSKSKWVSNAQTRQCILNVREYFEKEKANGRPVESVQKAVLRTAQACKVSVATVVNISKERVNAKDGKLVTPGKRRPRASPVTDLNEFQESAIRRHIYEYYRRKEFPTRQKLLVSLKEAGTFDGKETSLSIVLKKIGFIFKNFNGRKVIVEEPAIQSLKCSFLRKIRNMDWSSAIFLDVTWVNYPNDTVSKGLAEENSSDTSKTAPGKGSVLVICHAGGVNGFVPNALLVFESKKTSEYPEELNGDKSKNWFENLLLPNIPPGSTIVMDNAPYHSRQLNKAPTSASKKAEIISWLKENGVSFTHDMLKAELLQLVSMAKPKHETYEIDDIAKRAGHNVIRLPPYHCHYNPITLIWGQVNEYVAQHYTFDGLKAVENLFLDALMMVTKEDWKDAVHLAKRMCEEDWGVEMFIDDNIDQLVVNVGAESSSEDNMSEDED